jgi:hypothetical protein
MELNFIVGINFVCNKQCIPYSLSKEFRVNIKINDYDEEMDKQTNKQTNKYL